MKLKNVQNYFVKTLNAMAQGLFASLIIGLILKQIGELAGIEAFVAWGRIAQLLMGPAIGVAVAHSLGVGLLGVFSGTVVGALGAGTIGINEGVISVSIGEPVGAFIAVIIATEIIKRIEGKTKLDIIIVPLFSIIFGGIVSIYISPVMRTVMMSIGMFINRATVLRPIPMGIIISVVMGFLLTMPISSAAISITLGLNGLAAGASLVGCCTHMVGFAVTSYKDNGPGGLFAQGLGTSMLQVPNIIKNPYIIVPQILASAILGPIATVLFKMESNSIGAGMGTSGLVGQIGTIAEMSANGVGLSTILTKISILHFILPIILCLLICNILRNKGFIKDGDMKI